MDGARLRASITVCWGDTVVLHRKLAEGEDAVLGDDPGALLPVPCDSLGLSAVCVATLRDVHPSEPEKGAPVVLVPAGVVAFHGRVGAAPVTVAGPAEIALADGETASLRIDAFLITVMAEEEPRRSWAARSRLGAFRRPAAGVVFAGLIHAFALGMAAQSASDEGPERHASNNEAIARYLAAAEARSLANEPIAANEQVATGDSGASTARRVADRDGNGEAAGGARAAAREGTMGSGAARPGTHGRYAVARSDDKASAGEGSRLESLLDARNFGMIGLLSETPRIPLTSFGQDLPAGLDRLGARGDLWATSIGETSGAGGLGLSGTGDGGGGRFLGIGLGTIGAGHGFGHSAGTGGLGLVRDTWSDGGWHGQYDGSICGGYGQRCSFRTTSFVQLGTPSVRLMRADTTALRATAEGIDRAARRASGSFRSCYAGTVTWNADAQDFVGHTGTVVTRFVVTESGAVMSASTGSSTLPLPEVAACVARVFQGVTFPARPDGGAAGVSFPIKFGVFHSRQ